MKATAESNVTTIAEREHDPVGSKAVLEVIRWFLRGSFLVFFRLRVRSVKNCPMQGPAVMNQKSSLKAHLDTLPIGLAN